MKILITCPPMLGMIDQFRERFDAENLKITTPEVIQTLSVEELCSLVPEHDGWIIGDDPATQAVFKAGKAGRLRAAVKWGVGVDNVDFETCDSLDIPIVNTPNMFGSEVADIAFGYMIALARQTLEIDRGVRNGNWPKPKGISLAGKTAAIVGYGDVGKNLSKRLAVAEMNVNIYDPFATQPIDLQQRIYCWPQKIEEADFIIMACGLTPTNRHLLNRELLQKTKVGVRIVNVARGPLIDEEALIEALQNNHVHSAALDVFENEPLPIDSELRRFSSCIFGSHNASNTADAVIRTSNEAIDKLLSFLKP